MSNLLTHRLSASTFGDCKGQNKQFIREVHHHMCSAMSYKRKAPEPDTDASRCTRGRHEVKLSGLSTPSTDAGPPVNFNERLTEVLEELGDYYKAIGTEFKPMQYYKACTVLRNHPSMITSGAEAIKLPRIGPSMATTIDEILTKGKSTKLTELKKDKSARAYRLLTRVHGVGPATAHKFVAAGITTLEQLAKATLSKSQRLGLQYFHEFEDRISRDEADRLWDIARGLIEKYDSNITADACGSYRRGKADCGDLDILITHPGYRSDNESSAVHQNVKQEMLKGLVAAMTQAEFITDALAEGMLKFMGVCRLPGAVGEERKHRRIDIRLIHADQYYTGLLYFTGSQRLNIQMRIQAKLKGFHLNEYMIQPILAHGALGKAVKVKSEEAIFNLIGMDYLEPTERG